MRGWVGTVGKQRCVVACHFTASEWQQLERTGDPAMAIRLALGMYPEEGVVVEEYRSRQFAFDLPLFLNEKLLRIARRCNASKSAVVRAAVRWYLDEGGSAR